MPVEPNTADHGIDLLRDATSIAFICVANSARSQMAEAIARSLAPAHVTVYSAGSEPSQVNPAALVVLSEVAIDAQGHQSKSIDAIPIAAIDVVVTLCAEERCPVLPPGSRRLDWSMPDPAGAADELEAFRRIRDELRARLGNVWARP